MSKLIDNKEMLDYLRSKLAQAENEFQLSVIRMRMDIQKLEKYLEENPYT